MNGSSKVIREAAPAKINLFLHIVGRRRDGMHLIDSLVAFAALGDRVAARPAKGLSLVRSGPMAGALPPPADDLVLRAAAALAERAGVTADAALELEKNLPVAGGIGSGSADAAAALRALARLWAVDLTDRIGTALAAALGADLTVCLRSRPARVGGIGDRLSAPGPLPPLYAVLANPGVALATADVFATFAAAPQRLDGDTCTVAAWARDPAGFAGQLSAQRNDLTAAAISLCPPVAELLTLLAAQPGCLLARMSGSGATCFGLFADGAEARAAAAALGRARPPWWVAATELAGDA